MMQTKSSAHQRKLDFTVVQISFKLPTYCLPAYAQTKGYGVIGCAAGVPVSFCVCNTIQSI